MYYIKPVTERSSTASVCKARTCHIQYAAARRPACLIISRTRAGRKAALVIVREADLPRCIRIPKSSQKTTN